MFDVLIVVIGLPCLIILELALLGQFFRRRNYKRIQKEARQEAEQSAEIYEQLISEGWSERDATLEAHRRVYGKEIIDRSWVLDYPYDK